MKRLKKNETANKLTEKIPDPHNAKEHYQSFIRKKKTQNQYNNHQKFLKTQGLKTSHQLSKTIRQAEKVGSNTSLYSDTKKKKTQNFLNKRNVK